MIPLAGISDAELVQKLCSLHLDIRVDVVKIRRLGKLVTGKVQLLLVTLGRSKLVTGKVQLLLVTLGRSEQAANIITQARELCYSFDHQIRQSVFINPDLTPSEARAAFEMRQVKRIHRPASRSGAFIQNCADDGSGDGSNINAGSRNARSVGRDDHINIGCRDGILQPILEADADADVMEGEDCPEVTSA